MADTIQEDFNNSNYAIFYHLLKRCKEQGLEVINTVDPESLSVKCINASAGTKFEIEEIANTLNNILMTINVF